MSLDAPARREPDRQRVAFWTDWDGNYEIYAVNRQPGWKRALESGPPPTDLAVSSVPSHDDIDGYLDNRSLAADPVRYNEASVFTKVKAELSVRQGSDPILRSGVRKA